MALEKQMTLRQYGLDLTNAYIKIDSININNGNVDFQLKVYASKEARDANAIPLTVEFANARLKTLDDFSGNDIVAKLYNFVKQTNLNYQSALDA